MRGRLAAKMKTTINDPRLLDLTRSQAEMTLSFFKEDESNNFSRIEEMLGILWTREDVARMTGGEESADDIKNVRADKIRYPLALVLKPELIRELKLRFEIDDSPDDDADDDGKPRMAHIPKNAKSLAMLSKDDFMKKVGFGSQAGENSFNGPRKREDIEGGFRPSNQPRRLGG